MNIQVLFFAAIREHVGVERLCLDVSQPVSKSVFLAMLESRLGTERVAYLSEDNVSIAINQTLTKGSFEIQAGDEIAFMPPITGG